MSKHPAISYEECSSMVLKYLEESSDIDWSKVNEEREKLSEDERESIEELADRIYELYSLYTDNGKRIGGEFDGEAAVILHQDLNLSLKEASDTGFWRWLAFEGMGALAGVVKARFGANTGAKHYGVGGTLDDCYLKMLWFRANAVYQPNSAFEEGYELAIYGSADFWRSHVMRVDYGQCKNLVRAFVRVSRDRKLPTGDRKNPEAKFGVRDLSPEIKRQAANIAFELMTEEEAYLFLESRIAQSVSWCGKTID